MPGVTIDFGKRLVPRVVDEVATQHPHRAYASIPKSSNLQDGYRDISYAVFANAINRVAWWLDSTLGKGTSGLPTITYLGPPDLRYFVLAIAAAKVGYKVLFTSPRNSVEGHLSVLEKTDCRILIRDAHSKFGKVLEKRAMRDIIGLGIDDVLAEEAVPHYAYEKKYEDVENEPFLVLHTSGSTGLPKPIMITNGLMASWDALHLIGPTDGKEIWVKCVEKARVYSAFPPFHAAGVVFSLCASIFSETVIIYSPSDRPLNVDLAYEVMKVAKPDGAALPPSVLEDIRNFPEAFDLLKELKFVCFGGGPLTKHAGDAVSENTRLFSIMGATETFIIPSLLHRNSADWEWFEFHPSGGVEFRPRTGDLYELVVVRNEKKPFYQGTFFTFPDTNEYSMKDLYAKHPTKPGLWVHRGRADDVLVLSNGEKVNPVDMEQTISSHPDVRSALVLGQGKFQTALLIELAEKSPLWKEDAKTRIEAFWSYVEEANRDCPAHGRLSKDLVIFTTPEKGMQRASKGTVQRQPTVSQFQAELEELFRGAEPGEEQGAAVEIDTKNKESLKFSLRNIISQTVAFGNDFSDSDDLFTLGMDSLQVIAVLRDLKSGLNNKLIDQDASTLSTRIVYQNPSLDKLTAALWGLIDSKAATELSQGRDRAERMQEALDKYAANLLSPDLAIPPGGLIVALTGSTGSLGSYLLDILVNHPKVHKVYCLNRSADARDRQIRGNSSRGLSVDFEGKVEFLHTDFSKPAFGLKQEDYIRLVREVTHVIHNAWQVDFNLPLESFESVHIRGVRHLIDFAIESIQRAKIFFISSVSTIMSYSVRHKGKVPEEIIHDFDVAEGMGYGESKLVAERLLEHASRVSGVRSAVCRVGQIAGPVLSLKGAWNKQEWLPTIVASSKFLGKIPSNIPGMLGKVDWMPVDLLARAIVEMLDLDSGTKGATGFTSVYHAINPRQAEWPSLVPAIEKDFSAAGTPAKTVPFSEWVEALRKSRTDSVADATKNPGLKLLDFYMGMQAAEDETRPTVVMATKQTTAKSATLNGLEAVSPKWMETWLKQWNF
ncbi:MAG: hypothetical protein M1819_000636 [Sarea resinae]|nr:MAG: hypothetical protein M1819_000636 [Sarea resinae]